MLQLTSETQLKQENAKLLALLEQQEETLKQQAQTLKHQENTIELLHHQIYLFQHARFGRKTEKGVKHFPSRFLM